MFIFLFVLKLVSILINISFNRADEGSEISIFSFDETKEERNSVAVLNLDNIDRHFNITFNIDFFKEFCFINVIIMFG